MFFSARLKLTGWYLLIIMLISIAFSVAIYNVLSAELQRIERVERARQELQVPTEIRQRFPRYLDPQTIDETEKRIIWILAVIDFTILGISSVAGYFLAGRTLRPIAEMVDEQNRFITDASHELRTPITSLKTSTEVYLRDKKTTKETKEMLESNLEEINNLQTLSDSLIRLTQNQKKNGTASYVSVSIQEVIGEAQNKVANLAKIKNIKLVNEVKDFQTFGDKQSLVELFTILFDNAIKYSLPKTKITITSSSVDHSFWVRVKDEGIGIEKKDLNHIFDRFYRADLSRTKNYVPGYGLGLAIAKQIVGKHKGSIKVESVLDKGTIFTIQFPRILPKV